MSIRNLSLVVSLISLGLVGCSEAFQENANGQQDGVIEFADKYEQMFAKREPLMGSVIEGVSAYDEKGNPFDLESTRGKYTVLVFGCLT